MDSRVKRCASSDFSTAHVVDSLFSSHDATALDVCGLLLANAQRQFFVWHRLVPATSAITRAAFVPNWARILAGSNGWRGGSSGRTEQKTSSDGEVKCKVKGEHPIRRYASSIGPESLYAVDNYAVIIG